MEEVIGILIFVLLILGVIFILSGNFTLAGLFMMLLA